MSKAPAECSALESQKLEKLCEVIHFICSWYQSALSKVVSNMESVLPSRDSIISPSIVLLFFHYEELFSNLTEVSLKYYWSFCNNFSEILPYLLITNPSTTTLSFLQTFFKINLT